MGVLTTFGLLVLASASAVGYFVYRAVTEAADAVEPGARPAAGPDPPARYEAAAVERVKASTVGVWAPRRASLGCGFFAGPPGHVVTTANLVGPGPAPGARPTTVEVVVGAGSGQRTVTARVLAADSFTGLALLRVDAPDLPPPLKVGPVTLVAREPVNVYGFRSPHELAAGPIATRVTTNVSHTPAPGGSIEWILELHGGGLSAGVYDGGPVANTAGEVVGVYRQNLGRPQRATLAGHVQRLLSGYAQGQYGPPPAAPPPPAGR